MAATILVLAGALIWLEVVVMKRLGRASLRDAHGAYDLSPGATLDWSNFIGMRHIVEQIPLQNQLTVSDSTIFSNRPRLSVSTNVNAGIDKAAAAAMMAAGQQQEEDDARGFRIP